MPLTNFGAVLNFAEKMEQDDRRVLSSGIDHGRGGVLPVIV